MERASNVLRFIWRSTKRVVVMVVGCGLLLGGLVMLVTPGPGIVLIIAGFAVLATEFVWAERMLDSARERARSASKRVRRRKPGPDDAPTEPAEPTESADGLP